MFGLLLLPLATRREQCGVAVLGLHVDIRTQLSSTADSPQGASITYGTASQNTLTNQRKRIEESLRRQCEGIGVACLSPGVLYADGSGCELRKAFASSGALATPTSPITRFVQLATKKPLLSELFKDNFDGIWSQFLRSLIWLKPNRNSPAALFPTSRRAKNNYNVPVVCGDVFTGRKRRRANRM